MALLDQLRHHLLRVEDEPERCVEEEVESLLDRRLAFRHRAMLVDAPGCGEIWLGSRADGEATHKHSVVSSGEA